MTGKTSWNKGYTKETNERVLQGATAAKNNYLSGRRSPKGATALSKLERSILAKKQGFGGYRENAGRSKKFYYKDSFGNTVCLQSTYELKCAEILDKLGIRWVRPKHLKYDNKKYFPDFYLVDYNIFLDPKNDFLAKKDQEKIEKVCEQNNVIVLILTKDELDEKFIKNATESER